MPFGILSCYCVLLVSCCIAVEAKIVYLNGTEVAEDNLKIVNVTTNPPVQRWFSVFNPRNISNHSGTKTNNNLHTLNRKNDQEAQDEAIIEEEKNSSSNNTMATRDATVLSVLRGQWRSIGSLITLLSTILGIFLVFVIIESPLSPLPVPPLPYPPVGPFPPTNVYPFGVPPVRNHYGVRYAGPPTHGSYRIPRNLEKFNETEIMENMFEKVLEGIIPSSFEDFFTSKTSTWTEQLAHNIKSLFTQFSTTLENKTSQLFQEIMGSSTDGN